MFVSSLYGDFKEALYIYLDIAVILKQIWESFSVSKFFKICVSSVGFSFLYGQLTKGYVLGILKFWGQETKCLFLYMEWFLNSQTKEWRD